jgi:hypothetical protein
MVPALRKAYNDAFTAQQYEALLKDLDSRYPGAIEFRIAETPVFVPTSFGNQMTDACEKIIDFILDPSFKQITERSISPRDRVPNENDHSHFLVFDFGVCRNEDGNLEPQLIEMQGFPSLYGFQAWYPDLLRNHFSIPGDYSQYLNGWDHAAYIEELKRVILGDTPPENTILLEIKPHEQKTKIDFYCTRDYLGIQLVCLTELISEGEDLFYINEKSGKKTRVMRIYNRIIFDELNAQEPHLGLHVDIRQPLNVEWIPHPNWFYRISKFTMPFIRHPLIPPTFFLDEVNQIPSDLENYVLKPLFSFAGQGVIIDLTREDLDKIKDPSNWILQRKVIYADCIQTPDIPAKAEIRMMYLWKDGDERPKPAINLARLSKGKMIGVRYNKDKEWVGGSVSYFRT